MWKKDDVSKPEDSDYVKVETKQSRATNGEAKQDVRDSNHHAQY